jgi:hypothetical protein
MKKILIVLALVPALCLGQKKTVKIKEAKFGAVHAEQSKVINLESGDTTAYVDLWFQDSKYTTLVSLGYIYLNSNEDIAELIKDLKSIMPELEAKTNLNIDRKNYSLASYDFARKWLYVYERPSHGTAKTSINLKNVQALITWLEGIKFS